MSIPGGFDAPHPGVRHPRARRRGQWSPITDGLILSCAGLLVLLSLWAAVVEPAVRRVTAWETHVQGDGVFSIEYPARWDIETVEDEGVSAAVIRGSQRVLVLVQRDPVRWHGSARPTDAAAQQAIVRERHRSAQLALQAQFDAFRSGRWTDTVLGGRQALWSAFHAGSGSEEMTGYQATVPQGDHVTTILAVSPTTAWEDFRPVALHMLESLRLGDAQPDVPAR